MSLKKTNKYVSWCWKSVCVILFDKKHAKRDIMFLSFLVIMIGIILGTSRYTGKNTQRLTTVQATVPEEQLSEQEALQREEEEVPVIQAQSDTSSWIPYQNLWYGFFLKYPRDWSDPTVKKAPVGAMWEQKVQFRAKASDDKNPFEGFDVTVYGVAKAKELSNVDEYPKLKNEEFSANDECATIEGHLLEVADYPAEEIYIPISDACYNSALFFSNIRGSYIYIIAPKLKEGAGLAGDPAREVASHMPEFFSVAKNWELINIHRPKPTPPAPKITAPLPASFKISGGKRVCAKKNDHPSKSDQNKGKHMDMECCLDPDEYPNPNCYYSPDKYGKYLQAKNDKA